jgi:hypothetical protein
MVTKRTGRPRGRPTLRFLDDPDRYQLALIAAAMALYGLDFEAAARLALCTEGEPTAPAGKLSWAAQKRLKQGWLLQAFVRIKPPQRIDSRIDSLRQKYKRLDDDATAQSWLRNMRNAWLVLLQHECCGPAAVLIYKCCEAAGETLYATNYMLPVLRNLLALRSV